MPLSTRRFPPPWAVEELDACFVVIDSAEQKLAYVYFEEEPGRRSAAKLLTNAWPRGGQRVHSFHPLGDQLERGPLVQSATQIMMAASATKRISRMIRCMRPPARKFHSPTWYLAPLLSEA